MTEKLDPNGTVAEGLAGQEEEIVCPTYAGLVRTLAEAMVVDKVKMAGEPEAGFDHEDIMSWIGLVDFKEGRVPNIQANLSSERGRTVTKIDVQKQAVIESADEKATREQLIYSMALTEAKMKVVAEAAEEVYPAVAGQIEDFRKEMEKVREEVLRNKEERVSLNNIINMRSARGAFLVTTALLALAVIVSCTKNNPVTETSAEGTRSTATLARPASETIQPVVTETLEPPIEIATHEVPADIESGKLNLRCGGWPGLEKNDQPYDGTVGGLANVAAECNAMGESAGTIKIFTFNADTKFPANIDTTKVIMSEDGIIRVFGLEFQPTDFKGSWTDRNGRIHPRGVILTVPDGHGNAAGFGTTAPEGGWVLVTTDAANGKLVEYELFRLVYWH